MTITRVRRVLRGTDRPRDRACRASAPRRSAMMPLLDVSRWGSGLRLDTGEEDNTPGPLRDAVGPGYFAIIGMPIREGRDFSAADRLRRAEGRDRQRIVRAEVLPRRTGARPADRSGRSNGPPRDSPSSAWSGRQPGGPRAGGAGAVLVHALQAAGQGRRAHTACSDGRGSRRRCSTSLAPGDRRHRHRGSRSFAGGR